MQPELNLQAQADTISTEGSYTKPFIDHFRQAKGLALHTNGNRLLDALKNDD